MPRSDKTRLEEVLEEENLAFDAEIKELKAVNRISTNKIIRLQKEIEFKENIIKNILNRERKTKEDLRAKLLERDEKIQAQENELYAAEYHYHYVKEELEYCIKEKERRGIILGIE